MGFRLLDEGEQPQDFGGAIAQEPAEADVAAPLAPEDDDIQGIEVADVQLDEQGAEIPQGQVVLSPERGDHLLVNGVETYKHTALATMREACSFYNLSTSGGKDRCFKRLFEHQKKLELQIVLDAAREAQAAQEREPRSQQTGASRRFEQRPCCSSDTTNGTSNFAFKPKGICYEQAEEDHDAKKAKLAAQKKARIEVVKATYEQMIRAGKIGENEFHTMDNYEAGFTWDRDDDDALVDDVWIDEDSLQFNGVPEALWSDAPSDKAPGQSEAWVDKLADEVEIARLLSMNVLKRRDEYAGYVTGELTTRFVYDWRLKNCVVDGVSTMRWMRHSRFVAREFANTRRHDTYSPATGSHTNNLIVIAFLQMLASLESSGCTDEQYQVVLASLDMKDAFLQVPRENVVGVALHGVQYVVLIYLDSALGQKAWYWHSRKYATATMNFSWSEIQPCLERMARTFSCCTVMICCLQET
eukprot:s291_g4.t1